MGKAGLGSVIDTSQGRGLWASHLQGDERGRAASVFIALALSEHHPEGARASEFAYDRGAVHLRGAFMAMWAALDRRTPSSADRSQCNITAFVQPVEEATGRMAATTDRVLGPSALVAQPNAPRLL